MSLLFRSSVKTSLSLQIHHQQLDIDRLIAHHNVRMELKEKRKRQARRVIDQIWRELAQTNEATTNALRTNLEQVLLRKDERGLNADDDGTSVMDDAESCCESSGGDDDDDDDVEGGRRLVIGGAEDKDEEERGHDKSRSRLCRKCGKGESCVLILP